MKNFLFVGNSFTYFNDLPQLIQLIADPDKKEYDLVSVTKGGASLEEFAFPSERRERFLFKLEWKKWDGLILQENGIYPATHLEKTLPAAKILANDASCQTYFYQTWSYLDGSEKLASTGMGYEEFYQKLKDGYHELAKSCNGIVVPVGDGFAYMHAHYPDVNLYRDDCFHPNIYGSYLSALIFARVLFGCDIMDAWSPKEIDGDNRAALIEAALAATQEYK